MSSLSEPVIIHKSFEASEIHRLLSKFFKSRVVDGTIRHSIIFPKSSMAFLIQPICELSNVWPPTGKYFLDQKSLDRIEGFLRIHRNAVVFLTSGGMKSDEILILTAAQNHFANHNAIFLPVTEGASQCVQMILDIIQPKIDVNQAIHDVKSVCDGYFDENLICNIIESNLRVSSHDAMVIQDGCRTLRNVANAQLNQLMECSLSVKVAKNIISFFD